MLLDLATLKKRLGIPPEDTSKDTTISVVAAQAQALAENYCDRKFDLEEDDETFIGVTLSFQVRRFPLEAVTAIFAGSDLDAPPPSGNPLATYQTDPAKGLVWPSRWGQNGHWPVLRCQYRGGYVEAPPDLLWALTQIFDELWAATPGGGLEPGQGGGGAFDAVKRFSVVGAYSVELGSTGDAGGGSGSGGGDNAWGVLTPASTAVLDGYRRAARIGIG